MELLVNVQDEPEHVGVKLVLFGLRTALIPVEIVTVDEERHALVLR